MTDSINLYQQEGSSKSRYKSPFDTALAVVLFLLVAVCIGYGALFLYLVSMQEETASVNGQISQKKEAMRSQEATLVNTNDTYLRLEALKKFNKDVPQTMNHLSLIERVILPDVFVKEYSREEFTDDSFEVTLFSNFLDGSSKQLTAFRESKQFSGIQVLSMNLEEEGFETVVRLSSNTSYEGEMEMGTDQENL